MCGVYGINQANRTECHPVLSMLRVLLCDIYRFGSVTVKDNLTGFLHIFNEKRIAPVFAGCYGHCLSVNKVRSPISG
jgi:hypothetical protein